MKKYHRKSDSNVTLRTPFIWHLYWSKKFVNYWNYVMFFDVLCTNFFRVCPNFFPTLNRVEMNDFGTPAIQTLTENYEKLSSNFRCSPWIERHLKMRRRNWTISLWVVGLEWLSHPLKSKLIGKLIGPYCIHYWFVVGVPKIRSIFVDWSLWLQANGKLWKTKQKIPQRYKYEFEEHENIFPHDKINKRKIICNQGKKKKFHDLRSQLLPSVHNSVDELFFMMIL